ncbi:MAG: hypothetical protein WDW38_009568 [Sanguina aurantia]
MAPQKSRYTILIRNISSMTPKSDLQREAERCGPVLAIAKDPKHKEALVEFKNAGDAGYAYDKMHGTKMDYRKWDVSWATRDNFSDFGWKWTEDADMVSPPGSYPK